DIGALVEIKLVLQREHMAVGIYCDPGMVALLARMVRGHQVLAPVLDPFDRPLEPHCRQADEKVLRVELAADAEPSAGIAFLQHNTGRAAASSTGESSSASIATRSAASSARYASVANTAATGSPT